MDIPEKTPHWTDLVSADSPEMKLLHKSRMENPIMRAALTAAAADRAAAVEDEYTPPDWGDDE